MLACLVRKAEEGEKGERTENQQPAIELIQERVGEGAPFAEGERWNREIVSVQLCPGCPGCMANLHISHHHKQP